jgi:predicted nucleic-acid-binding protein
VIGLDTNVLVRYITQDDPGQSAQATALIESLDSTQPGFISVVAMAELGWVLSRAYRVDRRQLARVVRGLLDASELAVQQSDVVRRALGQFERGAAEFSDALIAELGVHAGAEVTATFDQKAARLAHMILVADVDGSKPGNQS